MATDKKPVETTKVETVRISINKKDIRAFEEKVTRGADGQVIDNFWVRIEPEQATKLLNQGLPVQVACGDTMNPANSFETELVKVFMGENDLKKRGLKS